MDWARPCLVRIRIIRLACAVCDHSAGDILGDVGRKLRRRVPFILAVVVLDTILSPIVVPTLMDMFIGDALVTWNASELILDLLTMVVLPTLIGVMLYEGSKGRIKDWSAPVAAISKLFYARGHAERGDYRSRQA